MNSQAARRLRVRGPVTSPFDLLAKDMLELLLEDCGTVERQVEVALPAQFVDVTFTPTPAGRALLRGRGLFGRMTSRRSAYECVHNPPSVAQLRELARKHLAWHQELTLRARRHRPRARVPLPPLYVVCAGRPTQALAKMHARRARTWPAGFYDVTFALTGMRVVVVPELPVTRATLPLRLMGRDRLLERAVAELAALPLSAWERKAARAVVEFLRRRRTEGPMSERVEAIKRRADKILDEAHDKGVAKGLMTGLAPLAHLFERRLKRSLTKAERATLRTRLGTVGPTRLGDVVLDLDADALAAWLADPGAR